MKESPNFISEIFFEIYTIQFTLLSIIKKLSLPGRIFRDMEIIEVINKKTEHAFLEVSPIVNRINSNYIRPLDSEIQEIFDKEKNKFYREGGTAKRWILKKDKNLIGRIAAYIYPKYRNNGTSYPVGCIGFFDCINNQAAANLLFDTAKMWLRENGMHAMDGPVNFGDRDKWWGCMISGFEEEPIYGMAFNPDYYQKLFENYGFKNYYNQYYFKLDLNRKLDEKFLKRYNAIKSKNEYTAKHINVKNLDKHAEEFAIVYNKAYAAHKEGKEITKQQVLNLFTSLKPIIDEKIIWFAYHHDEPIAFWINIPDINQYFKHFDGKLGLWQKLQLMWMKWNNYCKKFIGIAYAVVPKYQRLGMDSFMIYEASIEIQFKLPYNAYEMGWTGDWNPKMLRVYDNLNSTVSRKLITYRYIFDNLHTFERHPVYN